MYIIDGKRVHPMTLRDNGITNPKEWAIANGIKTVRPFPKHRYFYIVGSSMQKKKMIKSLRYEIVKEYPKIKPSRYDDGEKIKLNHFELF